MRSAISAAGLVAILASTVTAAPALDKRFGQPLEPSNSAILPTATVFADAFPQGSVFPLANGFPNSLAPEVTSAIQTQALGTLPTGGPAPPKPQPDDITSFQLIAFNELSETAYFTELIFNITNDLPGYYFPMSRAKDMILTALAAVQAQEILHAINANGALAAFGVAPMQPCAYNFPVDNFDDAIALASLFGDLVLGTLQDIATTFGENDGDFPFIRGLTSVIGQEGEQMGYYRLLQAQVPSSVAFLTGSAREFAWSSLQGFVVPGSCPDLGGVSTVDAVKLNIFEPLALDTPAPIAPQDQTLAFHFKPNATTQAKYNNNYSDLRLVYINQQNQPVNSTLNNVNIASDGTVSFEAQFPYAENLMNGLTICAVAAPAGGAFLDVSDVAGNAIAGPALFEIN